MRILDLTSGNRAMWLDKKNELATFVDRRREVKPDVVADSMRLPFGCGSFDMALFDPPHLNMGVNSFMGRRYGHFTSMQIRALIAGAARDAHRVVRGGGLMAFKWNDHDQKLDKVLALMRDWWRPLFGQLVATRTNHASGTYWVMLLRT